MNLSGNVNITKTNVYVCGLSKDSLVDKNGEIKIGDEILEVNLTIFFSSCIPCFYGLLKKINGIEIYGRAHSNITPIIKSIQELDLHIVILRYKDTFYIFLLNLSNFLY